VPPPNRRQLPSMTEVQEPVRVEVSGEADTLQRRFYSELWAPAVDEEYLPGPPHCLELRRWLDGRADSGRVQAWYGRAPTEMFDAIWWFFPDRDLGPIPAKSQRDHGYFFGVAPRSAYAPHEGGHRDEHVEYVTALWLDFDSKDFGGSKGDAFDRATTLPITPSAVVDSGHGYHCYWFLKEMSDAADAVLAMRGMAEAWGADPQATNASRVMRVVGSWNLKGDKPIRVRLVEFEPGVRYDLSDFDEYAQAPMQAQPRTTCRLSGTTSASAGGFIPEGQRNSALHRIACRLRGDGADEAAMLEELVAINDERCDPPLSESELRRIAKSAMKHVPNLDPELAATTLVLASKEDLAQRLGIRSALDLIEDDTILPREPILVSPQREHVFCRDSYHLVAGPEKCFKSLAMMELAFALASGADAEWLGYTVCGGPYSVLYVQGEGGATDTRARLLVTQQGVSGDVNRSVYFFHPLDNDVVPDLGVIQFLCDNSDELLTPHDILILDPLQTLSNADENSSDAMKRELYRLLRLARKAQLAIILVHHHRKPADGNHGRPDWQDVRGSSAFRQLEVGGVMFWRTRKDEEKGLARFMTRGRNSPTSPVHVVKLDSETLHLSLTGDETTGREKKATPTELLTVLDNRPDGAFMEDLEGEIEASGRTIRDRLKPLIAAGTVVEQKVSIPGKRGRSCRYFASRHAPQEPNQRKNGNNS
jgi:AAA domain-containing protein/primase-like protein